MYNKIKKPNVLNRIRFLALMSLCFLMYLPAMATAYSTSFDFGPVAVGATSTATVTIHNEESDDVVVTNTRFLYDNCSDFTFAYRSELKLIPAGGTLEIDVNYSPSAAGECSNVLGIWAGSPSANIVNLSGTGVISRALPEDKIREILEYLDTYLEGKGPGRSAENRFNALRGMIETAAVHIKKGQIEAALNELSAICKKVDGFSKPLDIVEEGPTDRTYSSNTLAGLIKDLMTLLESEAKQTGKQVGSKAKS